MSLWNDFNTKHTHLCTHTHAHTHSTNTISSTRKRKEIEKGMKSYVGARTGELRGPKRALMKKLYWLRGAAGRGSCCCCCSAPAPARSRMWTPTAAAAAAATNRPVGAQPPLQNKRNHKKQLLGLTYVRHTWTSPMLLLLLRRALFWTGLIILGVAVIPIIELSKICKKSRKKNWNEVFTFFFFGRAVMSEASDIFFLLQTWKKKVLIKSNLNRMTRHSLKWFFLQKKPESFYKSCFSFWDIKLYFCSFSRQKGEM